jgi:hypothetical protein
MLFIFIIIIKNKKLKYSKMEGNENYYYNTPYQIPPQNVSSTPIEKKSDNTLLIVLIIIIGLIALIALGIAIYSLFIKKSGPAGAIGPTGPTGSSSINNGYLFAYANNVQPTINTEAIWNDISINTSVLVGSDWSYNANQLTVNTTGIYTITYNGFISSGGIDEAGSIHAILVNTNTEIPGSFGSSIAPDSISKTFKVQLTSGNVLMFQFTSALGGVSIAAQSIDLSPNNVTGFSVTISRDV